MICEVCDLLIDQQNDEWLKHRRRETYVHAICVREYKEEIMETHLRRSEYNQPICRPAREYLSVSKDYNMTTIIDKVSCESCLASDGFEYIKGILRIYSQ